MVRATRQKGINVFTFSIDAPKTVKLATLSAILLGPPSVEQLASSQASASLDRLAEAEISDALPPGWSLRAVGDEPPPLTSVVRTDDDAGAAPGKAIRMVAEDAAGQAWLELDDHLRPGEGLLSWRWRVDRHLTGVVLREAELDDAPARFFVAFGGGGLFGRPRLIFYTWGGREPKGDTFISHVSDRIAVVVLRNSEDGTGQWLTERRNPDEDFRRAFDRDPDEIRAVGLMADTDQLGARAEVWLRDVRWESRGERRPSLLGPG